LWHAGLLRVEVLLDGLADDVSLLVKSQLLYLCKILKEYTGWNFKIGITAETFLQNLKVEAESYEPPHGLPGARIVRTQRLHLTARGKDSLKYAVQD